MVVDQTSKVGMMKEGKMMKNNGGMRGMNRSGMAGSSKGTKVMKMGGSSSRSSTAKMPKTKAMKRSV